MITDPPYADNVNYSELADFFYVWLRLALKSKHPFFVPEYCPKVPEIVENKSRGFSNAIFATASKMYLQEQNRHSNRPACSCSPIIIPAPSSGLTCAMLFVLPATSSSAFIPFTVRKNRRSTTEITNRFRTI